MSRREARLHATRGEADARALLAGEAALDTLPLADFGVGGPGEAAVRRCLHALRVPPAPVVRACRLLRAGQRERALAAATRYAYWTGARRALDRETWRRLTQGVAILMYYAIGRPGEPGSRFVLPARRFERQLRWLARRRTVLGLEELAAHRRAGTLPPAGAVVITLDDGYADAVELAAPLLRRLGLPATVFVVSSKVGGSADWEGAEDLAGQPLADSTDLARLERSGIAIGAHTRTHPRLPELDEADLVAEVEGSRVELRERLGSAVPSFAYPYGRVSRQAVAAVARAGFECACGIERGLDYPGTPLLELRRAPVDGTASALRLALAVRFGDPDLVARATGRLRDAVRRSARAPRRVSTARRPA